MSDDAMNFPDRQTPTGDEVFFDHVAWMTADMDRASAAFERLGFVLTPYSEHGNRDPETGERQVQGSANRLAMLELEDSKLPMHEYMVCLENRAETRVVSAFWEMAVAERD